MKSWMFILGAAALVLFLAGVPFGTILLFLGLIVLVWFGVTKISGAEQQALHDTYDGKTMGHHMKRWIDRIPRYLPDHARGHPQTQIKTYDWCGSVIHPIADKDDPTQTVGYQVDFIIFDMRQTSHTHRRGHLSFLEEEIDDSLDVAFQFWSEVDRLAEELGFCNSERERDELMRELEALYYEMYYELYPDLRPQTDEAPE